jgi:sulfopyruvate decarboxylase subunit beta
MSATEAAPSGAGIIAALEAAKVEFVVALPDIVTSEHVLKPLAHHPGIRLVRVCKEDEGISICAALSYCQRRAVLLIQHTGLLDSLNALRAIAVEYRLPICLMVGLQGREEGVQPRRSASYGVRIVEPILEAMAVRHTLLEAAADVARIEPTIAAAYQASEPVVMLVGRSPGP